MVANYINTPDLLRKLLFVGKGWQLTNMGNEMLIESFKSYQSKNKINKIITGKILINMDICCNSPWHLHNTAITIFDSTLHFELQMVDGDINSFINFRSPRY